MDESAELLERRARKAAYMRAYTAANAERINAQRRARYELRRETVLAAQREFNRTEHRQVYTREYNRRYQAENRESIAAQRAAYRETNRERIRQKSREYHARVKDRANALKTIAYHTEPQKTIERNRRWRNENPEKILAKNQRRRARKAAVPVETIDPGSVYDRDGGICGICGQLVDRAKMTLDHLTPLARGGAHTTANLQTAHRACNSAKGTRTMEEFIGK